MSLSLEVDKEVQRVHYVNYEFTGECWLADSGLKAINVKNAFFPH